MRIAKRVLVSLSAVASLMIALAIVKFYLLSPKLRTPAEVTAPTTPEAIARGRYLAHHVAGCVACHSQVDETKSGEPLVEGRIGSGRDFGEVPGYPAHPRAQNLTPDKKTGIGNFSDGELLRGIREGIGRDGRALFPIMPYQTYAKSLSDADALSIIAYLRTLPAITNDAGKTSIDFPVSMFIRALPAPVEKSAPPPPPESDVDARGAWLLTLAGCRDCHDGVNARREPILGKELAGGAPFPIPGKGTIYASNITSDTATGIGSYSDEDLMRIFNTGIGKAGRPLYGMPWPYYSGLTEDDKRALIVALRKVVAVASVVPPPTFKP